MIPFEQLTASRTVAGVPRSHWHCLPENFAWPAGKVNTKRTVEEFAAAVGAGEHRSMLLTGPAGTGKTHLTVALYRWAVMATDTLRCAFIDVPQLCDLAKAHYSGDTVDPFVEFEQANFLVVLDDVLGRDYTPHELEHIIYRLVTTVHRNGASLIVTQNPPRSELSKVFRPHEVSRLLHHATEIDFNGWPNYRLG